MLRERLAAGATHVVIDGILITTDRVAEPPSAPRATPIHLWCSGKHRRVGASVQFMETADGFPRGSTRCRAAHAIWSPSATAGSPEREVTFRPPGNTLPVAVP